MVTSKRRKRLGQHFLIDAQVIDEIIEFIDPKVDQTIVEIGPGHGALTNRLAHSASKLFAIETDPELASKLQSSLSLLSVSVIHGDALEFDYDTLQSNGAKFRIVGNLPYSISTQLIINFAAYVECIHDMCFMVQKEVADRLVASPGCRNYGRLTVNVSKTFDIETVFNIPPEAFLPPPTVQSAIIYFQPKDKIISDEKTVQVFTQIVRLAFGKRRKTLKNSLAGIVSTDVFRECGIDESLRAQNLSVDQFMRLATTTLLHYPHKFKKLQ